MGFLLELDGAKEMIAAARQPGTTDERTSGQGERVVIELVNDRVDNFARQCMHGVSEEKTAGYHSCYAHATLSMQIENTDHRM